ncbi:DUF6318 family protein [Arthrobacter gallicola]|uniref:DUF6318 family protein n=1 Tax=Arthrobacter gallicola TaxID=2762225 RepID=UPI001CD8A936
MFSLVERRRRVAGADADAGARFRRSAGGWLAAAVAGALLLSGCSGSGEADADAAETPSASPSATPSESQSPSPSPSAVYKPASAEGPAENVPLPVMPEEAKIESKEGLIAFARHWYDLVNYGFETGQTEYVREISGPDCKICNHFFLGVEEAYSDGGWLEGGSLEVLSITSEFVKTAEDRRQLITSIRQQETNYRNSAGEIYYTGDAGRQAFPQILEATYVDEGWRIDFGETMRQ